MSCAIARLKLSVIALVVGLAGTGCSDLTTTASSRTIAASVVIPSTTIDAAANLGTVPVTDPAIIASVISEVGGLTQLSFTPDQQACLTTALVQDINPPTMAALRLDPVLFDLAAPDRAPVLAAFDGCITADAYVAQLTPLLVAAGSSHSAAICAYTELRKLGFAKLADYAYGVTSDDGPDPTVEASVARIFKQCGVKTDTTAPPPPDTPAPQSTATVVTKSPESSAGTSDTTPTS